MLKYPISTLLYLAKINIKDKIQDALKLKDNLDIRLTVTVKDKDGKIIKQHKQKSHSFLMNYLAMIATLMANPYSSTYNSTTYYYYFKSTAGEWCSYAAYYSNAPGGWFTTISGALATLDGANDSTYGIVVGTGTAPPKPTDYNLESIIQNGTGSGQLVYGAVTVSPTPGTGGLANSSSTPSSGVLTPSGNTTSFQILRTFQNQSGASITVSETGIIAEVLANGSNTEYVLIIHDLLSSPITIPNGGVMAITYTISVST